MGRLPCCVYIEGIPRIAEIAAAAVHRAGQRPDSRREGGQARIRWTEWSSKTIYNNIISPLLLAPGSHSMHADMVGVWSAQSIAVRHDGITFLSVLDYNEYV